MLLSCLFQPSFYSSVLESISVLTKKQFGHCPSNLSELTSSSCVANLTVNGHEIISKRQKFTLKWPCVSLEGQLFFFSSVPSLGHSLYSTVCVSVCVCVCTCACSVGLPWWLIGKGSACNAGDPGSIPRLGRSPGGGRATHSSSPAEFHGQRSLMGYSPQGHTDLDMTERPQQQQQRRAQSRPVLCSSMHCDEAPLSRQEYRSGLPLPTPRDCPNPWIEPTYSCISCTGRRIL